jgi:amidase
MTMTRREGLVGAAAAAAAATAIPARAADPFSAMDATAQAALVRQGQVTPLELVDAAIGRIEALDPKLNAVVTRAFEHARASAVNPALADGAFKGVPFLIKDLLEYPGLPYMAGSRILRGNISHFHSDYAGRIDAAGLVVLGKSATPEFGLIPTTEPLLGPPTRNPWDRRMSCGGSSGGSAAAVAAGMTPFAEASDGGGSIRLPASICGLFGLKPSRGRNVESRAEPRVPDVSVDHCVSRSVRDSARFLSLTERRDAAAPLAPVGYVSGPSNARLKVALAINDTLGATPSPEVQAAIHATAALLERLGHKVEIAAVPIDGHAFLRHFRTIWAAGAAGNVRTFQQKLGRRPDGTMMEPFTLAFAEEFAGLATDALPNALAYFPKMSAAVGGFFDRYDVLLSPVLSRPTVELGFIAPTVPKDLLWGRLVDYAFYTAWQNIVGSAAMSVPLGWSRAGLPIGSQFTAAVGAEGRLLALAYELEAARPWKDRWPGIAANAL